MFTVLHRDAKGVETLYTAGVVRNVCGIGRYVDGVYLDPVEAHEHLPGDTCSPSEMPLPPEAMNAAHCILYPQQVRSINDIDPVVYVMNANGATVATYRL